MSKVSSKQAIFIKSYRKDRNATAAAIAAGYSAATAYQAGYRLLKKVEVQKEIERQDAELDKELGLSVEWVVTRLMRRANYDPRKFYEDDGSLKAVKELDDESAFALQGCDVEKLYEHFGGGAAKNTGTITKIKFADRDRALELLGRHLKMFVDKVEITGLEDVASELAKARQRAQQ